MPQATLTQILAQLPALEQSELQLLQSAVQTHLAQDASIPTEDPPEARAAFYADLLKAGVITEIHTRQPQAYKKRRLAEVEGKPLSETIIEERR